MIYPIFAILLVVTFALIYYGLREHDDVWEFSGYILLFVLGTVLMLGQVQYVDGYTMHTNTTEVYGWNYTDGSIHWNDNDGPTDPPGPVSLDDGYINLFHKYTDETKTPVYANYSDAWTHVLGFILTTLAALALILALVRDRTRREATV